MRAWRRRGWRYFFLSDYQPRQGKVSVYFTLAMPPHTALTRLIPLILAAALPSCRAASQGPPAPVRETTECRVTRIVAGDTVHCAGTGSVRLIGIDSPERSQPPFAARSAAALRALIPVGTVARLERDIEARDRYGRALGYIWRGGELVNWRMVSDGYAVPLTYPPNVQYVDFFASAQRAARDAGRGLWGDDGFACAPVEHRRGRC